MEQYKRIVEDFFKEHSKHIIANSSRQHAAILYATMFENATDCMRILCDSLSPKVFDDYYVIQNVKTFLNKENTRLRIGILNDRPDDSNFLKVILSEEYIKKVKIYHFKPILSNGKVMNFAVMDTCGYRFEPDHKDCSAIACANDEMFAKLLIKIFDSRIPQNTEVKN